ncbi:probable mitochondrial adenine nucleotide transporter BTL1 isoform X2 [Solanum pennellii]|uniref:Probable mitochondrial adenine nucleotide transporter BTL1 isoform X2 n=1 Tax=Solanum pennellii TaxID=28526 RepID=A0ABM1V7I3_SOLPN|nr:probable mitochondrial adenine nucleotide transporter BTL1 isoform X2 [Solanum pennellii]
MRHTSTTNLFIVSMAAESQSQKKTYCVVGDIMIIPKDFDLSPTKDRQINLQLNFPDDFIRTQEVGEFFSGALAGAMTKAILAPLETIRTRMVVGVGSRNIGTSFIQVIEQQGWQGLWAGNTINMLRIIPTQAIELGTFECVKRAMTSAQEKWTDTGSPKLQIGNASLSFSLSWLSPVAVAGAAAGVVSTLACHPLEVLKDRLTVSPEVYPSIRIAVHKIYKDGGIAGLYAGLGPTLIGMLPYSTCYYFMYETIKKSYCRAQKKESLSRAEMLLVGAFSGFFKSQREFQTRRSFVSFLILISYGKDEQRPLPLPHTSTQHSATYYLSMLIFDLHTFLFGVYVFSKLKVCHVRSNPLPPIPLQPTSTYPRTCYSHPSHTSLLVHLCTVCLHAPNHLSVTFLILSATEATPTLSCVTSFLIY